MLNGSGPADLAQYRVQRHFADHRALAPADAIEYAPPGPAERKAFERLRGAGVIRQTQPAHYWLDLDRMGRDSRSRHNPKTYVAVTLGIVVAALAYLLVTS